MKKKLFNFMLSDELKLRLKAIAIHRGKTMASMLNDAILAFVEDWESRIEKTKNLT